MGLLSRPAAAVDPEAPLNSSGNKAPESRWLFPLRRFEEEILDHILISASCSAPWAGRRGRDLGQQCLVDGTNTKERPMKDLVQRRFEKLGKNVAGKVKTLKHAFSENNAHPEKEMLGGGTSREECRKAAFNEIVRATLSRHPGSQLPDVFVSTLQAHFDSLPSSYAKAGFNSEQVFMHIRLLEAKSRTPNVLAVHLQVADCMSRSGNVSEFSSTSSSPTSSVWEETERGLSDEVVDVAFACNAAVSKAALVWVFEHEMVSVRQATVFEKKGVSLGVLTIQSARAKTQLEFVRRVIKSAIRKSRFSKFSLGLCGCEVPSFTEQGQKKAVCTRKEQPANNVASAEDRNEFKENYWNEADFNFTSTSFVNSGYEYGSYAYPCYGGGPSNPGVCFRILIAEGVSPEIISGEEELGRWVLDSAELHIEEEIASGASGSVMRGQWKGEAVAVKEIQGVKGGSVLEGELRRDVLAIVSREHKNLVPFYGISVDSRHSSFIATVSKFMAGGSLRSRIQRSSSIPLSDLLRIARDVAEGLRFLHDNGIVHRNLRSSRIMMDGNGVARVGDLGLARLWDGFVEGTPHSANYHWMAPEALGADFESSSITGKSDVYSYGMLLWEMLTGQLPFENFSPVQAAVGVAVHGLRPNIPEGTFQPLKCLIEQCWSSDPVDRPEFPEVLEVLDMAIQELLSRDKS